MAQISHGNRDLSSGSVAWIMVTASATLDAARITLSAASLHHRWPHAGQVSEGWQKYYWTPMTEYLRNTRCG